MKKITIFIIMTIATFSCFASHDTTEPDKELSVNVPFMINSKLPGTCRVYNGNCYSFQTECTRRSVQN